MQWNEYILEAATRRVNNLKSQNSRFSRNEPPKKVMSHKFSTVESGKIPKSTEK